MERNDLTPLPADNASKGHVLASLQKETGAGLTATPVLSLVLGPFYCAIRWLVKCYRQSVQDPTLP